MTEKQALVRIDPQYLLQEAVKANASIETLERLVALAKDVREVQAREAWHEAMAEFQRRCPAIKKTNTAQIATAKGYYSYRYAALDEIMETIRPLLGELGLSVSWSSRVEPQRVVVSCRIAHALGYSENSGEISMPVPDSQDRGGANPAQRVGSALTYARRYSLLQVTGLAPEDDDDARAVGKPEKVPEAEPTKPETQQEHSGLPSVDDWRERYEAARTMSDFTALEGTLKEIWSQYSGEEKTALKFIRDKAKTALSSGTLV